MKYEMPSDLKASDEGLKHIKEKIGKPGLKATIGGSG
jgi:hypothetical protein